MVAATGIVIIKKFTYRGDPNEEFSNKYWLTGDPPGPSSEWAGLFDVLVAQEKACYVPQVHVVGGYGYNDNTPGAQSIWSVDLEALGTTVPGTLTAAQGFTYAGDQAGMLEWQTDRKNSRGKWVYLRKYFHGGITHYTNVDEIAPEAVTAYETLGTHLRDGTIPQAVGRKIRSQKQDENLQSMHASKWITTRTLKRRGKRP